MSVVKSIGGISIATNNPRSLAEWYAEILGIHVEENTSAEVYCCDFYHRDMNRPDVVNRTVWTIVPAQDVASPAVTGFTLSYTVESLDTLLEQLQSKQIDVEKIEEHDHGRSAWIKDPEGRSIELWED